MPPTPTDGLADARSALHALRDALRHGAAPGAPADADATLDAVGRVLEAVDAAGGGEASPGLLFDVSDLFGYYEHNRLPTGVQRVQTGVVLAMLDRAEPVGLVRFVEGRDEWLAVPAELFRDVARLSMAGGDPQDAVWRAALGRLEHATAAGERFAFARDATLVNLGTSWWLPNYFLHVRRAKADYGIRYVPMVHDVIPVLFPEQVIADLVHEFIDWLMGVVRHGDAFIANSQATRADFLALTARMGCPVDEGRIGVMPLDAAMPGAASADDGAVLRRLGLQAGGYVLQVATIDVRKNQLAAFEAWDTLIGRHGTERMPRLVCVGKKGFDSDRVLARREQSDALKARSTILHRVDDGDLAALYRNCFFTLYPTLYEGWGLPVSESLAYGKVPLTSDNSSLPEAGRGLSVMVPADSRRALADAAEKLIFDHRHRQELEARIVRENRPRGWTDVAADLAGHLDRFATLPHPAWQPPLAAPGYYPLVRNRVTAVAEGSGTAEPYRLSGWSRLDDGGCRTLPRGGALRMRLPPGTRRLGFHLAGLPTQPTRVTISTGDAVVGEELAPDAARWLFLDLSALRTDEPLTIHIASQANERIDGKEVGVGLKAFFVFDPANPRARIDFLEAAALKSLDGLRRSAPC